MNINCPQCGKEYEIDDSKIPEGGAKVKCSQCETMIDIDYPVENTPDWYITTDNGENVYEASDKEVTEWIHENRLLKEHKISKDNQNWTTLAEIPKFMAIFTEKEREAALTEEPTQENSTEEPIVKTYKKIDYTDYDDSIIEPSDAYKPKKNHFFIWFFMFLIMGAGIFALVKPKLVKSWFTQMGSEKNIQKDTDYDKAMTLLKKYNPADKDKILTLFDNILKKNPADKKALVGRALCITYSIYLEELNLNFRTELSRKLEILSKQNNNEIVNKILIKNNKKQLKSQKKLKILKASLTEDLKTKIKSIEATQKIYNSSVVMGLLSYFNGNKNSLTIYLSNAKKINSEDSQTAFLKLLYLKLKKDKSYLVVLDEITTKYANSIPLNFLNSFELLAQNKYGEAKFSFKGIKGLSPENKLATEYILLLNELIKNKDLLVINKTDDNKNGSEAASTASKNGDKKKEEKEHSSAKQKEENNKKTTSKPKKAPVKLSPARATEIGWELIDASKYSAAIKKFRYAISMNPNYAEAYQGLGEVYRIRKDNENALKYFKIFLAKDPHNSEAGLVRRQIKKLESEK